MQKTVVALGVAAFMLAPAVAFGASFAKQSLFLSRSAVTEGETVLINAVVNNDSTAAFSGTLLFAEGTSAIGTVPVTLAAGEAQAVSVSWKPAKGSHKVSAELKKGLEVVETQSATFTIAAKPTPAAAPQSAAAVESSQNIQDGIAAYSPQTASVAAPLFTLIDSGRAAAADIIDAQISGTKKALGPSAGEVLNAEETKNAGSNPLGVLWFILRTLYLYLLTIARFLVGNAALFYPVLALAFLYSLWKLFRRFRRPAY
ncbi:hypothetical protein A3D70_01950 [Candidatus Adlerbacteria bacterium RIFCSPHIGHO2_02_FULL_54_18]|uniref:CARDB domain-containing protein n=2 Tax=Candidatus Adleribacteriota TaxID=1752736 RepID=A0A1F4Y295_9BACT|nr:MAG: hypothetical protein A2949_02460 [Candidatus Adlerbacteria bacterium RIFCSPLOWO2_01_FULL_54_21b]OGC87968.1 MAG: hypothetical protein A3D70_01950 [Candidatus Adlerbacteria bacterium RIFCSPHIGHO2_02_FULL_54_18]